MTQFLREIYEQPSALRATSAHLIPVMPTLPHPTADTQVILTGMGSSFCAAYAGAALLLNHGIRALAFETSELLETFLPILDDKTLLIVVSQSGRTIEVINLLEQVRCPMIAITNAAGSFLAQRSHFCLTIQAGEERTVASKTYTAALAALALLSSHWSGDVAGMAAHINVLADTIESFLSTWEQQVEDLVRRCTQWQRLVFIGRGISYTSAVAAALMCQEAAKLPAEGLSGGQFRHGYIEALSSTTQYILFDHPLNRRLARELRWAGAPSILIGSDDACLPALSLPSIHSALRPALEIVPIQLLAAHLVKQQGIEPDVFRYGSKVVIQA